MSKMIHVENVIAAFNQADSMVAYRNAKRLAERLNVEEQFAVVDTIIAARKRITSVAA